MSESLFQRALSRALLVISSHPSVVEVVTEEIDPSDDPVRLEFMIDVAMSNRWRAAGQSPNGVRRIEPVAFDFRSSFPRIAPELSLRSDFGRDKAHVQPWLTYDGRPVPCIYEGLLSEFFFQQGIAGILNQTANWLEKAAAGALIDPEQGWEPTRRDRLGDYVIYDGDDLRGLVNNKPGHCFLECEYLRVEDGAETVFRHAQLNEKRIRFNRSNVNQLVTEYRGNVKGEVWLGRGLALLAWSDAKSISDTYYPETVSKLSELWQLADCFGCKEGLRNGLDWLQTCSRSGNIVGPFGITIILCARRPFPIIGTSTTIEVMGYFADFLSGPKMFPNDGETPIHLAAHRHKITPSLMEDLSGSQRPDPDQPWTLIGAGSLGSKIALHMARAGQMPSVIIDHASMSPHNVARHAIIPPKNSDMQLSMLDSKVAHLKDALSGFGEEPKAVRNDVRLALMNDAIIENVWPEETWATVNSTASLAVRAALCADVAPTLKARVIETVLFAEGQLGLITTEGPRRNPDIGDLMAEFYHFASHDDLTRGKAFNQDVAALNRTLVGEGCGSMTMKVTDSRLSIHAAGMSEYILHKRAVGLPANSGEFYVGNLDQHGIGIGWQHVEVPPAQEIEPTNNCPWKIRLSDRAHQKIVAEVERVGKVETGGVIVGRLSEVAEIFYIIDVLEAPSDSVRSPTEFTLGVSGLRAQINSYAEKAGWTLFCLGTWHSHLAPSGPSALDKKTAEAIALARLTPSLLLIHTPSGYDAIIADVAT